MYRLCLLVLLGVWQASAQLTTPAPGLSVDCNAVGIQNCDSCDMPGLTCALCPINAAISADFRTCTACDVNCVDCALDKNDKPVCSMCAIGFILKSDGTCMSCGSWCNFCTFVDATQAKVQCTQCAPSVINYLLGPVSKACQDCTLVSSGCISCSEATDLTLTCTACGPSFYYDSTSKSCTPCPNNCQACSMIKAVLTCTSCRTGYILNNNAAQLTTTSFACLSYDPLRCKATGTASTVITTASTCSSCLPGYYLDSSNLCQYCPEGCLTCTSASACQTCSPSGYYLDKASSKCMACSWGCNSCTVSNNVQSCSACMAGFGLQSTGSVSCQYCPANCASCSDPATCDTCDSWSAAYPNGFALVVTARGTECLECPDHCVFSGCTDDSFGGVECTDCGSGRVNAYDADGYSICIPCSQNCDTCTYDENFGTTTCITCVGNQYYVAADGTCKSCASNCIDCTGADDTCLACAKGYFLDTSGTNPKCTKCATANCDYCDFANNCTTCTPGYYLDTTTITCKTACDSNCICTDSVNTCTGCLVSQTAADDAPYNFYDSVGKKCQYCDIYCAFGGCGADGECTTCIDGYIPDTNGKCTQCDIHCQVGFCTYTTSAQCSACEDGYYVNAGKCSKCSTGCMTCPAGVCSACFSDYVSNGASPAVTCYANDAHCAAGSSVYDSAKKKSLCNNCENYYTALNGVCTANPTGCLIGTLDDTETFVICDTCDNGYGKVIATSMCSPCPVNCASCTQNSVTLLMECDVCESDAVENKNPCGLCPYGCTACRNVAGSMFCSACAVGYYLDTKAGDCVACTSCSSCTASGCNAGTCFAGFGLSTDGFCTDCSTLTTVSGCSNCTDVDSTGMSKCLDCSGNQVLDGWGSFCQDFSTLTNCEVPEFRAFECAFGKCTSPFSWVLEGPGRGMCGLTCAVCGDIDAGIYLPESECQNSANNYTEAQVVGACWVSRMEDSQGNVLYARGGTMQFNCTSDHQEEFTSPYDSAYTFKCCQSGDGCSDSLMLDGQDGAAAISFSLALLFASILVSLRLF